MSDVIGNNNVIHNGKNGYVCNTLEDYIVPEDAGERCVQS